MQENKKQIGVRIPKELNERLERHVEKIGISKPAFILGLIYNELEKAKTQKVMVMWIKPVSWRQALIKKSSGILKIEYGWKKQKLKCFCGEIPEILRRKP